MASPSDPTRPPTPSDGELAEQAAFVRELAAGTGLDLPTSTVQAAITPVLPQLLHDSSARPGLIRGISSTLQAVGLRAAHTRGEARDVVSLAEPGRPVLLVLRHDEQIELCALFDETHEPVLRLEVLRASGRETQQVPIDQIAERLGLIDGRLVAAFRIETMAGEVSNEKTSSVDYSGRPLRRLWHLVSMDRTAIWIVVAAAVGLGILTLATPVAVQSLVNFVAFGGLMQPLIVVGLLLLFFLAFAGAIRVFKLYVVEILQRRVFVRVVSMLASRLPRVRLDAFDRRDGPELVNRFFDVLTVQKAGSSLLINGLDAALQAGIGLLVLGFYHPFLLVFDIVLILAILFIFFGLGRGGVRTANVESVSKYEVADALEELARAPMTYRMFGAPEHARARLAELTVNWVNARRKHYRVVLRQNIGAVTLHAIAATGLLTLGGTLVIQGQLTLGQMVAAELIVTAALVSFVKFGKEIEAFYDLMASVGKLGVLLDLPLEDDKGETHAPEPRGASVELRNVTYRQPGPIRDLDLRIEANERVAIRGIRGTGKSMIAELMAGLRDPDRGVVLFDGIDIRDIANVSMRAQLDIFTELEIVSGTVLENIRLGRSDISAADIRDALTKLGILDEVLALPDGMQTELARSGAPLSRTTAQLLVLSRCIAGRPRTIVLDRALDLLDSESLPRALEALGDRDAPWTLVVFTSSDAVCDAMQPDRIIDLPPYRRAAVAAAGTTPNPGGDHDAR